MQSKWGSHGDIETICYSPSNVQEFFDFTITAFNTAERYRTPVFVMADQIVATMWERLKVPPINQIEIIERKVLESGSNEMPYNFNNEFAPKPLAG